MSLPALTYFDRERLSELTLSDDELLEITQEERDRLLETGEIAEMVSSIVHDSAAANLKAPIDMITFISGESYTRGFYQALHIYRGAVAKIIATM